MKKSKKNTDKNKKEDREDIREKTPLSGIWSGTISFSLVAIPVRLVRAVDPGRISFRMLHDRDYSPLQRRMICPEDQTVVEQDEIIRGYEIEPGRHIPVTDDELKSVSPERSSTIEIIEFIDINDVDPIYYDHPYFLVPLKGGEKAYNLLAESMKRTGRAGVAKFVLVEREYFVLVKNRDGVLELTTLHYSDEILPEEYSPNEKVKLSGEEKNTMKKIIREMSGSFTPEKYSDGRREKLLEILKKKIKKNKAVEAPEIEEDRIPESMTDLMEALQESMQKIKKTG